MIDKVMIFRFYFELVLQRPLVEVLQTTKAYLGEGKKRSKTNSIRFYFNKIERDRERDE